MKLTHFYRVSILAVGLFFLSPSIHANLEALPNKPPIPASNPMNPEKIKLGKQLYFDKRLSSDNTVSCNTCHDVTSNKAGTDSSRVSTGVRGQQGDRNSPTVLNAPFLTVQFWDGRAKDLEEQAKGPIINPIEMGMKNHDEVIARLKAIPGYVSQFQKAFKGDKNPVTIDNAAKAIAAYERTLIATQSPVDRYLRGDKKALTPLAIKGMQTFQTIGCTTCHGGSNFSGPALTMGQGFFMKFPLIPGSEYDKKHNILADPGRFKVTHQESDRNLWRVPSLRNVAATAPYFHNGSVQTLDEAVRVMGKTQLGRDLSTDQVQELVAFLEGLTGKLPKEKEPKLP